MWETFYHPGAQPAFTCSKLTIETLEQGVKYCSSVSIVNFEQVNPGFCDLLTYFRAHRQILLLTLGEMKRINLLLIPLKLSEKWMF